VRVVEITQPGPPEVLKLGERPDPSPAQGEVLIDVEAAGVNRPDVLQRLGKYPPPPGAPKFQDSRSPAPSRRSAMASPGLRSAIGCVRWWLAAAMPSVPRCRTSRCCRFRKA